jgi:hypothetical protein
MVLVDPGVAVIDAGVAVREKSGVRFGETLEAAC